MAYLRKEDETIEIDHSLEKVWVALLGALAKLKWRVIESNETEHYIKARTKGGFMSYPSTLIIETKEMNEKTVRCKVLVETPVTTITSIADFGKTRERINLFFAALSKQLTNNK